MSAETDAFYMRVNQILQEFPQAGALLNQPGVLQVYLQAVSEGWSSDRIEAALENTDWWKNTDQSTRQWQALSATDPATASQKLQDAQITLQNLQDQLGIHLSQAGGIGSPYAHLLNLAVTQGWDETRLKYELIAAQQGGQVSGGDLGANAAQVKAMANDYGVPLSDLQTTQWAQWLTQGNASADTIKGYLIEQAKSLFPSLSTALDQGITVAQYADPYKQLAVQELGVNPSDINWTDPKWNAALNQVDPKSGQRVSMSLDQWLSTIRSDPRYGYDTTQQGRQSATQLASALQQKFGAAA